MVVNVAGRPDLEDEERRERYPLAHAWIASEVGRMRAAVEPNYEAETSLLKITVVYLAKRTGLSEKSVRMTLKGRHLTVERWWTMRWAMNVNVSGHTCFEDYSYEFAHKLRRMIEGRFGTVNEAAKVLKLDNRQLVPMLRGRFTSMTYFVAYCYALGVEMPSWRRHESVDFLGHHDDQLTSPPLLEEPIPRGLLRAGMTTDHIRTWLVLPRRDTPRSAARLLGLPTGFVSGLLMEMERYGLVRGEKTKEADYSRRYERVETYPPIIK
jgi:hypothetical protein